MNDSKFIDQHELLNVHSTCYMFVKYETNCMNDCCCCFALRSAFLVDAVKLFRPIHNFLLVFALFFFHLFSRSSNAELNERTENEILKHGIL